MDIATSKWFRFLNENKTMITEGLDDIEIIMRGKPPYLGGLDSDPDSQTPEVQKLRKIVKFVLENLTQTVTENEYGTWSKAFRKAVKALGKAGAPPEKIEEIKAGLDNFLKAAWHNWWSPFRPLRATDNRNDVFREQGRTR